MLYDDKVIVVDPVPVLPRMRCGRHRPDRVTHCAACRDTGYVGEEIGPEHVLVNIELREAFPHTRPRPKGTRGGGTWVYLRVRSWDDHDPVDEPETIPGAAALLRDDERILRRLLRSAA